MARSLLITGIGELVTNAPDGSGPTVRRPRPGRFAAISDAALVIEAGPDRVDRPGGPGARRRRRP